MMGQHTLTTLTDMRPSEQVNITGRKRGEGKKEIGQEKEREE